MNADQQEPKAVPAGFASLAAAKTALKLIARPVTEEHRRAFITKLLESPHPKQLAFRLLALLLVKQAGRNEKVLSLLQTELTGVLAGGMEKIPEEILGSSAEDVILWVHKQFPFVFTLQEASHYLETEQHLWTLFQILRWSGDTAKFMVALASYTNELETLSISGSSAKKRREVKKQAGFSSVVKKLIKWVPSHPTALESFLENLRLCRTFVATSAELQERLETTHRQNDRLKTELQNESVALATEKTTREAVEAKAKIMDEELKKSRAEIERLEDTLRIQAGAYQTETVGASAEILTAIRRKLLPDLENIRLYADRTDPNAAAIVRKAQELTHFLNDFKNK
jgi:hypothetical protein